MKFEFVGVDGCRAGWFCVFLNRDNAWSFELALNARALGDIAHSASTVLIDVPIGLIDSGENERRCDKEARRCLGRTRAASVFPAPARKTLGAGSYREAVDINRKQTGRGISRQAWAIVPKMREIDELLRANPALVGVVRECHPEVCFWALNGGQAMQHNKKTAEGRAERLRLLEAYFPDARVLLAQASSQYLRRQVALDDIVDAMVVAVTTKVGTGRYRTLPDPPEHDAHRWAMEIVYALPY